MCNITDLKKVSMFPSVIYILCKYGRINNLKKSKKIFQILEL